MAHDEKDLQDKQRYFVLHLEESRFVDISKTPFQIQILDSKGRAKHVGYVGFSEETLNVSGCNVPKAVLEAARRQLKGQGDYVDSEGNNIPFWW